MDVSAIKQHLIDNPDDIVKILESLDFYHITDRGKEFRCAKDIDSNPTSVRIDKANLFVSIYSDGFTGDIITLVEEKRGLSFKKSLRYICEIAGLTAEDVKSREVKLPFGGFWKQLETRCYDDIDANIDPIDESILLEYTNHPNQMFLDDGISVLTQYKYGIGYDLISGRVTIPHYSLAGDLIGVMGRWNGDASEVTNKYIPITDSFPKGKTLFGYHRNYKQITKSGITFIVESEKGVMQLDSMGYEVGLSSCCNSLTKVQVMNVLALHTKAVILCYDEGLNEDYIREQAKKLKIESSFIDMKVGYVFDRENKYLPVGSKASPTDFGKDIFDRLIKECVYFI